MRLFQGLAQAFADVFTTNDTRPTREMQSSCVTLAPQKYIPKPGKGSHVVLLSQINTFFYRPTYMVPIDIYADGTNIFSIESMTRIGEDEQGMDLYSTGLLEKLQARGYDIWIVVDMTFFDKQWLIEQGIGEDRIINEDEQDITAGIVDSCQTTFDPKHAIANLYKAIGLKDFVSRPLPSATVMLSNLTLHGIGIGPNPCKERISIH